MQQRSATAPIPNGELEAPRFLSKKIGYGISFGAGLMFAAQRFAAQGLWPIPGLFDRPGRLDQQRLRLLLWLRREARRRLGRRRLAEPFGAAYPSRTWMTNFDKYSGLFADRGSFDIPALATAGVTFRSLDTLEVSLQYQHIFYGQV